ncbi:MAG: redox-sensing transcriptional repressor Rex [Ignavibacteria bacterium]|nr:redox-sensing transcriptional repressor Rex [Ignavibacteria bacterium]
MNTVQIKPTPEPTLRRLPLYHQVLIQLKERGVKEVSSTTIANELKLDSVQVRKDIEHVQIVGKPRIGFNIDELILAIEKYLNWDNLTEAFLVGSGHLGFALAGYKNFAKYGLNIIAAFDNDPEKIGTTVHGIPVLDPLKIPDLARRMHIHIGVLAVPAEAAQENADLLIEGGIKGIWNFAPTQIKAPFGIVVENAQLTASLSFLKRKLTEQH